MCVCVRPQVARRGPGEGERARGEESEESEKEHGAYRVPTGMQLAEPSSSSLVAWLASADAPEPGSVSSTWTTGIGAPNRDISSDRETASSTVQVPRVPRVTGSARCALMGLTSGSTVQVPRRGDLLQGELVGCS